jgi:hypothetical protein
MDEARIRARYDWLVEVAGALAPGLGAGFAAFKLAPSFGFATAAAMTVSGLTAFGLGLLGMRAVRPEPREHVLAGFRVEPIERDGLLPDGIAEEPLLLEVRCEESLLLEDVAEHGTLLLDDPLVSDPDSRVVQLFASPPMPTPGQMKEQIDRHLATGAAPAGHEDERPAPDASDALYAALAELRRSLR